MQSNPKFDIEKVAKDIVSQIAVIIRTAQIHDASNVAVVKVVDKFVNGMNKIARIEGSVVLELVGEYFFLNEKRVKFTLEYVNNFDFLAIEFANHKLGSITFKGGMTSEDIQAFLRELIRSGSSKEPFEALSQGMEAVRSMEFGPLRVVAEDEGEIDARRVVKKTYFGAVSFTKGVMKKMKTGERVNVKKAKRIVQSMADVLLGEEELLMGMTAIKDYDDYTYHHSVNVSILSIALGQRLGMSKKMLLELGLAALFHDLGKLEIPTEILNKPSEFTPEEWEIVKRHPFWGVKSILSIKGIERSAISAAIVAYEHHIHQDTTGYPNVKRLTELDFFSRIVGIVDQYDGMTSARVYSREPLPPDRAFQTMLQRSGTQLDPVLIKYFINMVGVYPAGTLVMLNTRELGIVYSSAASPVKPKVMVIMNSTGQKIEGHLEDLSDKTPEGDYKRRIIKTLDPNRYKVNLAEYML